MNGDDLIIFEEDHSQELQEAFFEQYGMYPENLPNVYHNFVLTRYNERHTEE